MDDTTELSREMDRLSLTQALVDVEVANARVTDLTQRLVDAANEIAALRAEIDHWRGRHEELDRAHHRMVDSRTYRIARGIEGARRLLTGG